jgi:hypothetical protein
MYSIIGVMTQPKRSNYIRAYHGKIEAIKDATTQVVDMMNPFVAIKEGDSSSLEVSGQSTPTSVYELYLSQGIEITIDEAYNLAVHQNRLLRKQAEIAILGLQASATLLCLSEQTNGHKPDVGDDFLIRYAQGKYATIEAYSADNKHVWLSYVQLDGLSEGNDDVATHEITVDDGILVESLAITSLNATVRNIKHDVRAMEGGFLNQCVHVLGKTHIAELLSVLKSPVTEIEIDSILGSIWNEHSLKDEAEEVALLLNEIKRRALLMQRTREMNSYSGDTSLPNENKLNKYGRLLGLK